MVRGSRFAAAVLAAVCLLLAACTGDREPTDTVPVATQVENPCAIPLPEGSALVAATNLAAEGGDPDWEYSYSSPHAFEDLAVFFRVQLPAADIPTQEEEPNEDYATFVINPRGWITVYTDEWRAEAADDVAFRISTGDQPCA